ncbi:hypothetical protein O7627_35860 [Solwaraspora sp. WMMD1047]|uniref:hypothetical protein n=1 Tax=Solwaraspora sp. WMMD1047 TaxID=3016102 RepID=UPI002417F1EF|nr:hypothetical protein [Solwaraspora sp. WMMD1047]MDG4834646.1 hypothetical protein [Solwaraspora sp. WMMD1047]
MTGRPDLPGAVWRLLHEALEVYRDSRTATDALHDQLARFDGPLRIAVVGGWRSGRSTLINAVLGEEVAPVEVPAGGAVLTWYEDGPEPRATAYAAGGVTGELVVTRSAGGIQVDLGGWRPGRIDDIVVRWPTRALRQATFLDTPALPPGEVESDRGGVVDRILREADALLYLTRDGGEADLRFLESVRRGLVGRSGPVNVIMVLSRADEAGGGRIDALLTAKRQARRLRRDPRVSASCRTVVPFGGLVALAGRLLSEPEFAALGTLAALPRAELDDLLLSTDRFLGATGAPLPVEARRALLDRLGIFGVRLATTLIRSGSDTRASLAAELVRRSGLLELREAMARYLIDRREALRARGALAALEDLLRARPRPGARELLAGVERILAGAHEFAELGLLAALQDGVLELDGELAEQARPLVGGNGTAIAARLGVDHEADPAELWARGNEALRRWQDRAEDPELGPDQRRAARTVVRSCEGILAELYHRG